MLRLNEHSLDWALQHALKYGDTDVFPFPFEYYAIAHDWDNIKSFLLKQDIHTWVVRPNRVLLSPKSKYGFRVVTQIDPLDFLVYSSIIKDIASDIESRRIHPSKNIVFSYRYQPNDQGQLFNPSINYGTFESQCNNIISTEKQYQYIAITDITDFYPKIYLHRLENALNSATSQTDHIKGIIRLISGWNGTETFGIPVGSAPTRLLAEITISDIDEALLANNIRFIRFNDDYRIFAHSHTEAYKHIALLAEMLFKNHGLTLQPKKTDILSIDDFKKIYLTSPDERELYSLNNRFEDLLNELGISDRYQTIDYDDLEPEQQELVDSLNLVELFQEGISTDEEIDIPLIKFILRRMAQLRDPSLLDDIFDKINTYPLKK
ncbi:hypothetical protein BEH94_03305 [Candidatus Altiarchaeales archaeon WOR_SM1_SCG]|nr:hypothetical protein BEH94_03305 [Candidatus Altiarchaeales archaeon WOR_SM1_SCG]